MQVGRVQEIGAPTVVDADSQEGGAKGSRTPDLYNAIVALYQLSYGPECTLCVLGLLRRKPKPIAGASTFLWM